MLNKEDIKVVVTNKPTKEESEDKIKALCEFLGKVWKAKNSSK